jgi:hypothetical protein
MWIYNQFQSASVGEYMLLDDYRAAKRTHVSTVTHVQKQDMVIVISHYSLVNDLSRTLSR